MVPTRVAFGVPTYDVFRMDLLGRRISYLSRGAVSNCGWTYLCEMDLCLRENTQSNENPSLRSVWGSRRHFVRLRCHYPFFPFVQRISSDPIHLGNSFIVGRNGAIGPSLIANDTVLYADCWAVGVCILVSQNKRPLQRHMIKEPIAALHDQHASALQHNVLPNVSMDFLHRATCFGPQHDKGAFLHRYSLLSLGVASRTRVDRGQQTSVQRQQVPLPTGGRLRVSRDPLKLAPMQQGVFDRRHRQETRIRDHEMSILLHATRTQQPRIVLHHGLQSRRLEILRRAGLRVTRVEKLPCTWGSRTRERVLSTPPAPPRTSKGPA